jgi:two-component system phosphate regulon sensor histidine kinase PhoR
MTSSANSANIPGELVVQKLLDACPVSVLVINSGWKVSFANRLAVKAFSRDKEPIQGKRLSEVLRDPGLHAAFRVALETGLSEDLRMEFATREKRIYDVSVAPLKISNEDLAIGFFRDITQLERLETARQEFLSNISHELRTPLTSILAFVETLEDGAVDDAENNRRFLNVIRRNADRMKMLIDDILELSFIESGKVSIDPSDIEVRSKVDEIFANLVSKSTKRSVVLINDVVQGSKVYADSIRLDQMLTNLIDNAIKFNKAGGSVRVSFEKGPGRNIICVADTGEGIVADHLDRIFERFYRGDRARSREIGGTGLGLAIVKHLARLHGGEVSVSSELTVGCTFRIEFPLAKTKSSTEESAVL